MADQVQTPADHYRRGAALSGGFLKIYRILRKYS
jgi:hypothetical protein